MPSLREPSPIPRSRTSSARAPGLNLALDYLPGAITFDPLAWQADAALASRIVWFDAFVTNVDRTARNTNMLVWHNKLWLIDHGAALYFHHSSGDFAARATSPFAPIKDHVLLPFASELEAADAAMTAPLAAAIVAAIVALIPDDWLDDDARVRRAGMRPRGIRRILRAAPDRAARLRRRRRSVPDPSTYDYADRPRRAARRAWRVRQRRRDRVVAAKRFLAARFALDQARLRALDAKID